MANETQVIMNGSMTKLLQALKKRPNVSLAEAAKLAEMPIRSAQNARMSLYAAKLIYISGYKLNKTSQNPLWSVGNKDDFPKPITWDAKHLKKKRVRAKVNKPAKPKKAVVVRTIKTRPIPRPQLDPLTAYALKVAA